MSIKKIIFLPALLTAGYLLTTAHVVLAAKAPASTSVSVAHREQ